MKDVQLLICNINSGITTDGFPLTLDNLNNLHKEKLNRPKVYAIQFSMQEHNVSSLFDTLT